MAHFSLSWDAHKQNICKGLSALQQNEEFVDMTIAADGHHVKVHQMVLSLVSPYIKDLIRTAHCPHPVIFLNKVSYTTLCAILEYIYTGTVLVKKEDLSELVEAGKELHIQGLEDMKLELSSHEPTFKHKEGQPLADTGFFYSDHTETRSVRSEGKKYKAYNMEQSESQTEIKDDDDSHVNDDAEHTFDNAMDTDPEDMDDTPTAETIEKTLKPGSETRIQYTISNQGSLQMILNRFVYYLRYTSRKGPKGHRQWRCADYNRSNKCPASVITIDDVVTAREPNPIHVIEQEPNPIHVIEHGRPTDDSEPVRV